LNKADRIRELIEELNRAANAYYKYDNPIMTDKQYDDLYDELSSLEKETGYILTGSPTQKVQGDVVDFLEKVEHKYPMLSANKTKDLDMVRKFIGNRDVIQSWKMDGCFSSETKISMADGTTKRISDIKVGDKVLSFDENTKKLCSSSVINTYYNGKKEWDMWLRLTINKTGTNGNKYNLKCTKNHKIFTPNGWKKANEVSVGNPVYYDDYILSKSQESFILGSLLGDGHFVCRGRNLHQHLELYYTKTNKPKYKEMIKYTNELFAYNHPKISKRKSGYGSDILVQNFHSIKVPEYIYNVKNQLRCGLTFTREICDNLTPLALAILYIDDGSKCPNKDDGYAAKNKRVRATIATNRHRVNNVKIFSEWLNNNGFHNAIMFEKSVKSKDGGDGYIIKFTADGTEKFFDNICQHIPKELREIKLGLKDKWQNAPSNYWWKDIGDYGLCVGYITHIRNGFSNKLPNTIRINQKSYLNSYDLEIEGTHTYFANGYAVHNCTIVAEYKSGELYKAVTRGSGTVGEDVTHTFKHCVNLPVRLRKPVDITFRGECVIPWDTFERINSELEEPYSHPRNLAAGTLRQLDANIAIERKLEYYVFDIVDGFDCGNLIGDYVYASGLDMTVVEHCIVRDLGEYFNKFNPENFRLPVDGLIYRYDDTEYGKSLGTTSHHPLNMLALKWQDQLYETILTDIEWNTSKTGLINPVAIFKPVDLDGAITTRATLHNVSYIEDLELGIGDSIMVYRANMVIPKVHENLTKSNTWKLPDKCPCCGGEVEIHNENGSKTLHCCNDRCQAKLLSRLTHYVSKNALNIENLSEATIEKFMKMGWLTRLSDIYTLQEHKNEMMVLDGFGKKSTEKLLAAIEKSKMTTLERYLYGIYIPLIGRTASKTISKYFKGVYVKFIEALEDRFDFSQLEDFGITMNKSIYDWYEKYSDTEDAYIPTLLDFDKLKEVSDVDSMDELTGKVFVITGSLLHYANRNELVAEIEGLGGKVSGSVSAKTNYLINNDSMSSSSKNKKANELKVPIIAEEDFLRLIGK